MEESRSRHVSQGLHVTLSLWLLLCLGLTFSTVHATSDPSEQPMIPAFVESRVQVLQMPGSPPEDYQYLAQHVRGAEHQEREEYYRRWQAFVANTVQCDQGGQLWWFMSLASLSVSTWMEEAHAAVLESLVMDDPACAVRGMQDISTTPSLFINTYLMNPTHHSIQELDAALSGVLERPEFGVFAASYRQQFEQRETRIAAQQAAREARAERERRQYWGRLGDRHFYDASYDEFVQRWDALVLEVSCDAPEQLGQLLATARLYSDDEYLYQTTAEMIADLIVNQPACMMAFLDSRHDIRQLTDTYFVKTSRARDIYDALFGVKEDSIRAWKQYIERVHWHMARGAELGIDDVVVALYPTHYKSFGDGHVYIPMPYHYSVENTESLVQLWQATPDGEFFDTHDQPIKILPPSELAFMERDEYDTVYLLSMRTDDVEFLPARVVAVAISSWSCGAPLPMLVLEPDRHPDWLKPAGSLPVHGVAMGIPNGLAVPKVESTRWSENYIFYGSFFWEELGRAFEFSYTHAFVNLEFSLVDSHNRLSYGVYGFPSCH